MRIQNGGGGGGGKGPDPPPWKITSYMGFGGSGLRLNDGSDAKL